MTLPVTVEQTILQAADWDSLVSMSAELSQAFNKRQIFRTETEARVSVLDVARFPTKAARYWQAVREQVVMLEQLALLSFEYRRNEVSLQRLRKKVLQCQDIFDREEAQIDIDEGQYKRASMRAVAADRVRELRLWSKLKSEADDGSFDTDNVDAHQLVSYAARFALAAASAQPNAMSSDELLNLSGQLKTSMARCKETGAIDELYAALPKTVADELRGLL